MHYLKYGEDSIKNKVWSITRTREGTWRKETEAFFSVSEPLTPIQIKLSQNEPPSHTSLCTSYYCTTLADMSSASHIR